LPIQKNNRCVALKKDLNTCTPKPYLEAPKKMGVRNARFENKLDDTGKTILDALQGINRHLAIINGRLEMLLLSDLPEYVLSDLIKAYQAEQDASQIVHGLNLFCHKSFY
jgi:hypothetical protein